MRRRGWLGASLAGLRRLEHRLTMDLLWGGSAFVRIFSDGRSARVAPLTGEEFHETAQALSLFNKLFRVMQRATVDGHGRHALARELQQTRRCPLCHSAPMQCPHVTLDVFSELQERLIADPTKHRPWPFQHAGRWPL